jgi:GT2 family glycosyltransferase
MPMPTFTIVVPTHRRTLALARCLASLEAQEYTKSQYEVVVVDDAAMPKVVEPVVAQVRTISCRLLTQDHRGPAAARNCGADVANGRFLAFTDDDCRPSPEWLCCLERRVLACPEPVIAGGRVVNDLKQNPYACATQALVDYLYEHFNRDQQHARLLTSNNLCVPADAFRAIGGFDPTFVCTGGEDRELCLRWAHAGHRLIYAPEALVYHAHEMSLSEFARQHHAYGRGAAVLRQQALRHGYGPVEFESMPFYLALLSYPFTSAPTGMRTGISLLFALSQLANTVGFAQARLTELAERILRDSNAK